MSTTEIIIASLVFLGVLGQLWLTTSASRRTDRQIREAEEQAAAKKAQLIEREFDKQNGNTK